MVVKGCSEIVVEPTEMTDLQHNRIWHYHNHLSHTCQVLRFRRSYYGFLEKLKTTAVVRNDYGFTLGWGCNFFGNQLIMFGLFLDELMGLSQYR